ncbi:hypothetical protein WN943_001531 [Citrus x changshan-huyou]
MNGSLIDANFLGSSTEVIGHFEGKRLMFIGDSVHRSEFQSMEYNGSIEFYRAAFAA